MNKTRTQKARPVKPRKCPRAADEAGLGALVAWDEAHRDAIVYPGGPLGPTKRKPTSRPSAKGGQRKFLYVTHQ